jgi:hypothetical protein
MIVIPAIISRVSTMADGGIRITIDCNEMPVERIAELMKAKGQAVAVAVTLGEDFTSKEQSILKEIGNTDKGNTDVWAKYG